MLDNALFPLITFISYIKYPAIAAVLEATYSQDSESPAVAAVQEDWLWKNI